MAIFASQKTDVNTSTPAGDPPINPLRDQSFFVDHKDELMVAHEGEFVAIRGGEVVGVAATRREIDALLDERFGKKVYALVRMVCEESFQPADEDYIVND